MSIEAKVESKPTRMVKRVLTCLAVVALVLFGLVGSAPLAQIAVAYLIGGPPLDFDAPHNGRVVAHIDILGKVPPEITRIRISAVANRATVWDVKPSSPR